MLAVALIVSGVIAAILLAAGFADRDQNGALTWSGRLWLIFALAIICGCAAAGWAMWGDPDRLREGEDYWTLAVPIFGIGYFVLAFACLLRSRSLIQSVPQGRFTVSSESIPFYLCGLVELLLHMSPSVVNAVLIPGTLALIGSPLLRLLVPAILLMLVGLGVPRPAAALSCISQSDIVAKMM